MKIRKATPADAAYLAESCVQIARFMREGETDKYIDGFPNDSTPDLVDWARSFTNSEDMAAFMAEAPDGKALGCIYGSVTESVIPISVSERTGHITICWVAPDHHKSGIGRALLKELERWFLKQGIRHLEVSYMVKNKTAVDAWAKLGFSPFRAYAYKTIGEPS